MIEEGPDLESPWTVGPGRFGGLTPGVRTWLVSMALANKLSEKYQVQVKVRGYRMPKGTWAYSVVADDYQ